MKATSIIGLMTPLLMAMIELSISDAQKGITRLGLL
jgi:hypothetical protein